ncbi:MAG: hypothetical protein QM811_08330 [Pirellulales bacterium]
MNLLGKIFVFLILFLSVAFMAMSMMVYATHRNFRAEIENSGGPKGNGWKTIYAEKSAEAEKLIKERDELSAQLAAEKLAAERTRAIVVDQRNKLIEDVKTAKESLVQKEKALADATQTNTQLQANLEMHAKAEAALVEVVKTSQDENKTRFATVLKLSDENNALSAQIPNLLERAKQLAEQVATAKVMLGKYGKTLSDPLNDVPPPVDGLVTRVGQLRDPNLIELSLGFDDGMRIGHTVDLFRGPNYLGRATITAVEGNRSVAKVLKDDLRAPVKDNDGFTTRLQYLTSQNK